MGDRPDLELGPCRTERGVRFSVVSTAERLAVALLDDDGSVIEERTLAPETDRRGPVWSLEIEGLDPPLRYGWRVDDGPLLLDPYARRIGGWNQWGVADRSRPHSVFAVEPFDWQGVGRPRLAAEERIVYELSVRAFTAHPSSDVEAPGTFRGLVEKIPYLVDLGVTTIELMPVTCWDECGIERRHPVTGERLRNLWGYDPISFTAPHPCLAAEPEHALEEFKTVVRELHRSGLEVVLDVVFNHTGEGELGAADPVYSWAGLAPELYYLRDGETGAWRDLTGCGNTVRTAHPVVRDLILDALTFWAEECRVDGFRFDLAAVLTRDSRGEPTPRPELPLRIASRDLVSGRDIGPWLVAEPWDAAGLVQLGQFPSWGRWSEWNGRFRDHVRRFVRAEPATETPVAERLAGSPDLYGRFGRGSRPSVNYVTSHDGFTLADLVAYDRKHNEANGEENRDGSDAEFSSNCGHEGPSDDPEVLACRRRRSRLLLALLLSARGTPLLRAGDEIGRTQCGNNNAYCQDNEIGWLDWSLAAARRDLLGFVREFLRRRRDEPALHAPECLDLERDVLVAAAHLVALRLRTPAGGGRDLVLAVNAGSAGHSLRLPAGAWSVLLASGDDGATIDEGTELRLAAETVALLAPVGVRSATRRASDA